MPIYIGARHLFPNNVFIHANTYVEQVTKSINQLSGEIDSKQDKLKAGPNITINSDGTISAQGAQSDAYDEKIEELTQNVETLNQNYETLNTTLTSDYATKQQVDDWFDNNHVNLDAGDSDNSDWLDGGGA